MPKTDEQKQQSKDSKDASVNLAAFKFASIVKKYPDAAKEFGQFVDTYTAVISPAQICKIFKQKG